MEGLYGISTQVFLEYLYYRIYNIELNVQYRVTAHGLTIIVIEHGLVAVDQFR